MSEPVVRTVRANGTDIAFAEAGEGEPLVLIHGSLSDYRYWTLQMRPLSEHFRVIAPSLRHYYPEQWDGEGDDFSIAQHREDIVALIESLDLGSAHVLGHSRGGHVAFRIAQHHPEHVRRLILAEPGGTIDPGLSPAAAEEVNRQLAPGSFQTKAEALIRAGDIDGGLRVFIDAVSGAGAWDRTPARAQQFTRDNAMTLLGQIRETREPFTREAAEAIQAKTLFILGGSSPTMFGDIIDALRQVIAGSRKLAIAGASHTMNVTKPAVFNAAVIRFLSAAA